MLNETARRGIRAPSPVLLSADSGFLWWHWVSVVIIIAISFYFGFTGFLASDDFSYSQGAVHWLRHFPYLGQNHWELRHTIVLPLAASFSLFGISEPSLILVSMAYVAGLIAVTGYFVRRRVSARAAYLTMLVLGLTPLFATGASTVFSDIPEVFFIALSLFLYEEGMETQDENRNKLFLFSAGLACGLAYLTRETTFILIFYYIILFFVGRLKDFSSYLLVAVGFLAVFAVDTAFLALHSGDILYRLHTTIAGIDSDNPAIRHVSATGRGLFDPVGGVNAPWPIAPIAMMFASHYFGLLFLLALPLGIWLMIAKQASETTLRLTHLFGGFGLTWFLWLAYGLPALFVTPRYQSATAYCAAIVLGLGCAELFIQRRRVALSILILFGVTALAATSLDNKDLLFGERTLVRFAATSEEPIYTDYATARSARFLLDERNLADRVLTRAPPAGALYFYNSSPARPYYNRDWKSIVPNDSWIPLETIAPPKHWGAYLVEWLGLTKWLPDQILQKLTNSGKEVVIYHVQ
ncbi:MAG TPA: glycosyltransferase family 39 protein [Stellaceae bacterium]|nr:glycosyltransferase family 39 protein [Stellaceae bacterium]